MRKLLPILLLALFLTGCGGDQPGTGETAQPTTDGVRAVPETTIQPPNTTASRPETTRRTTASTMGETRGDAARAVQQPELQYGYTYGQASGNRVVEGTGRLPESEPVDVQLDGVPTWVVGVPLGNDTAWVVTLEDGRVQAFRLEGSGQAEPVPISPDRLASWTAAPGEGSRRFSGTGNVRRTRRRQALRIPAPLSLETDSRLLGVEQDGTAFLERGVGSSEALGIAALPDDRFVRGANGTLAALSSPTERYDHAVLGDGVEADSMTLLRPGEEENLEAGTIFPESGGVFEAVAPLWFEVPGADGELLAVMESTVESATRISVYSLDGSLVAAGPFIGEPYKWRHLLAAGPFGPNGEIELVDTLTPHIGGTIEFYRPDFDNGSLDIVATQTGYTSHRIYTRNLDTARAGDLDGDGRWELLVPNDSYTELGAIRHEEAGATVAWTLPADGTIVTNLASATNSDGRAQIAAGREDGMLRIWP